MTYALPEPAPWAHEPAAKQAKNPPHGGEMHPDGDELLFLVEGVADVALDEQTGERIVRLSAGEAFVVLAAPGTASL